MRLDSLRLSAAAGAVLLLLSAQAVAPAPAKESDRIFAALGLKPGLRVADVGAGDGEWAERLAREVGEAGHVFATEVDADHLEKISKRVRDTGLDNVTTILGTQHDTGLPAACCDAVLLRMVYHHFVEPARMRASLRAALRPEAPLVVIDTEPKGNWRRLEGVPDRGGHGIREEELVAEMIADGFEVVARHPDWNGDDDRYCVVFVKRNDKS
jgi:ubiquinone/menaquinone biosynthesis C-methylase UbiE